MPKYKGPKTVVHSYGGQTPNWLEAPPPIRISAAQLGLSLVVLEVGSRSVSCPEVRLAKDKFNDAELAVKIVDVRHYDEKTGACTGEISRSRNKARG